MCLFLLNDLLGTAFWAELGGRVEFVSAGGAELGCCATDGASDGAGGGGNATFCGGEGAVVEGGLLDETPDLGQQDGPEEEHGDDRGDGLLAKDAHSGIEQNAIGLRREGDLQGGAHAQDGFEDASLGDADVAATGQQGVDLDFVAVGLELATDRLDYLRYLDRRCLQKLFFAKDGHDDG